MEEGRRLRRKEGKGGVNTRQPVCQSGLVLERVLCKVKVV